MVHHDSHPCPLVWHNGGGFTCDGCRGRSRGYRYRCHNCDFDLHQKCATYGFPCHQHRLTYEARCPAGLRVVCDACNTKVSGANYGCQSCDFYVHPGCEQRQTVVSSTSRTCKYCHADEKDWGMTYCSHCSQRRQC